MEPSTPVGGMFTSEQITSITAALTTAINNTLSMFVQLLPVAALICGVAFGIRMVRSYFSQAKKGR